MNNDDLISAIYTGLDRSTDYATVQLQQNRADAWDRILNRARGDEIAGRSQVQATTIRDTFYSLLSTIMPAYQTDNIASFPPQGADDVDQADAESRACNAIFVQDNNGYLQLHQMISDAIGWRNGIIKCWIEDKEISTQRRFLKQPGVTAAMIQANSASPGEEWEIAAEDDEEVTFRVTKDEQQLRIESIEPAYFFTDPNQQDQNLMDAGFMAERAFYTRSDLKSMDVSSAVIAKLKPTTDESVTDGVASSNTDITAKFIDGQSDLGNAVSEDQDMFECYWVHMLIDTDGDGISEKWRFLVSGREILMKDPVDLFPYASATGWPVPHRWSGLSVYDLLVDSENQQTNARRQLADNLNYANNQQPIGDPGNIKTEDVLNRAPGRLMRRKEGTMLDFAPIMDITSNSLSFLQYMDEVVQDQAGATMAMQGGDSQLIKQASGVSVEMQLAPREQMASQVSRNIAETGVKNLFLILHETLRTQWKSPIMFFKSGEWIETHPSKWQPRKRVNIVPGLSPGDRRRKASNLHQVVQTQLGMVEGGTANITVDWNGVHSAIRDWMDALELDATDEYFLDPDSRKSQAGQDAAKQNQQMQQQQMQQGEAIMLELEKMKIKIDAMKAENDRVNDEEEIKFKYVELAAEQDMEQQKLEQTTENAADGGSDGRSGANGSAQSGAK